MIIGLTGLMGSGKDTAADAIMKEFPQFKRYALAGPIKELADRWLGLNTAYNARGIKESTIAFDMNESHFDCLDILIYDMFSKHPKMDMPMAKKVSKRIYNEVLKDTMYCNVGVDSEKVVPQYLITTPRRIWQIIGTEGFRETVSDTFWLDIAPTSNAVITDIRFPNEAKHYTDDNKNVILEIVRSMPGAGLDGIHASELGVPPELIDYTFCNEGTIECLQASVADYVSQHLVNHNTKMR